MFQKMFQIGLRDVRLEFSSPMAWLTFLILPVVFTIIFAGQFGEGDAAPGIALLVVDEDGSALAADLIERLEANGSVRPVPASLAEAEAAFSDGEVVAVLHLPAGFETAVLAGNPVALDMRLQPSSTNSQVVSQAVEAELIALSQPLRIAAQSTARLREDGRLADEAEATAWFTAVRETAETRLAELPARIELTQPAEAAPSFDVQSQQALGQLITWVFIPLIGVSVLFVSERQYGTLRRMLTTPTGKATYMGGVIAGQLGKGLVQMLILVLFGALAFGIGYGRSPGALALLLFTFGLASVALGTMLGTFIKTDGQANGLSIMLGMVLALLGGCWYPLEFFPPAARFVANFTPTSWALQGMTDLVVRGQSLSGVLPEAGVLLGFAAVFFAVGVWRFRYE